MWLLVTKYIKDRYYKGFDIKTGNHLHGLSGYLWLPTKEGDINQCLKKI